MKIETVFQFTTSQGGRPIVQRYTDGGAKLSIHDLTRRSTATFHPRSSQESPFNSRPHKEVDLRYVVFVLYNMGLSIHDLTRRSTFRTGQRVFCGLPFNSRPHKEVDCCLALVFDLMITFQFTTSQGGRLLLPVPGGDQDSLSIHDLTRRSTDNTYIPRRNRILSIHDLTRRSTSGVAISVSDSLFQFTTSQGGRRLQSITGTRA